MPSFDAAGFDPPAPVAEVELRNAQSGVSVSGVRLLIDTGADVTLVPRQSVEQLGIVAEPGEGMELLSFDGSRSIAPIATLDIAFLSRVFRGRYLLVERDIGILGRDVLNHVRLLLDGPAQHWGETDAPIS